MARAIDVVSWTTLTATINEIKSPNTFLKYFLFASHESLTTETVELSYLVGARNIAPFVRKNGEAIMVTGYTSKAAQVEAPNIRIKRPMEASKLLFERPVGTPVHPSRGAQSRAIRMKIAEDTSVLADMISNAEEYLCAMALRGTISYEVADEEVFTITHPRPAGHNTTATNDWDAYDEEDPSEHPNILGDIRRAKKLINDEIGLTLTDCILGESAADAFLNAVRVLDLKLLDVANFRSGVLEGFVNNFRDDGTMFLGRYGGINFWEYSRQANLNGVATDMVRSQYAEFVARSPAAGFRLYYGAIPDHRAIEAGKWVGERFSKSWQEEDPSVRLQLGHSRPLPVTRRPGAIVSMQVVGN